ncbi:probable glucuronosyltransferase Os03g0107900 [Elaeis guineensis]|uniref:Probable glucuronosyltransferase Os03g0107900 n=1 Tax=Elaeis guineensis var. tenera TaxID=51953 RepID=A0A6I9QFE5_ELAGV|nr:probable glucuronosyltransferase Os03g0107900 [Elaeis guineensis]
MPELRASHHKPRSYFPSHPSSSSPHMKLLPRRTHPHHHYDKALYLKKYSKWLLWLGLSIYLFSSSSSTLFPRPTPTSLPQTTLPLKTTPRALIEARNTSTSPPFKIYVYDLPSRFNRDWLADQRCETHLFAAEVALHEAFLDFPHRALDPNDADFFFVPVYVSCNFSTPNGFPSLRHARPLLASAVELISSQLPFWNRSRGRDHLFVASHDYGACFHAMEDRAIENGIPEFLKESIILQTFGVRTPHVCQEVEHVQIPPYVPPDIERWPAPETAKRDIWVFFRGKMEVHPKNISGRFYGKRVRTDIWNRYNTNPRFYLRRKRFAGYRSEIARSVFCLCPLGWAPWSPRLVEAVALGCVPVIIADGIRLPFPAAVRWSEISLTVAERDVGDLEPILDHVAATNLSAIQLNLWDTAKRRALLFHRRIEVGDATWQVLKEFEGKLDRSWRRGRDHQLRVDSWR